MQMDLIANSKNDEFYTPVFAIIPLIGHIRAFSRRLDHNVRIWCPFDTKESYYVKIFEKEGFEVINTHISEGNDFFELINDKNIVDNIDIIISNPPYSKKTEILEELFKLNKPFAMLISVAGLFDSKRRWTLFSKNEFEMMFFSKRCSFLKSYQDKDRLLNPPFTSYYICHDFLEKPRVFEKIDKKNIHLQT